MVHSHDRLPSERMDAAFCTASFGGGRRRECELGEQLKLALADAREEERLVCGVYDCATRLQKSSSDVALCVLANDCASDAMSHISFVLLEAFCWESFIPVLKVDSAAKLKAIVDGCRDSACSDSSSPFSCLLVEEATPSAAAALSAPDANALRVCRMVAAECRDPFVAELPAP